MLEAFERHLKQHNIAKQFEEAKTKEEKIEVCRKFLESEGLSVRPNLDPELQLKEQSRYRTMGVNPKAPGTKIMVGSYTPNNVVWDSSQGPVPALSDISVTTTQAVKYLQARVRVTENFAMASDKLSLEDYVLGQLSNQIAEGVRQHIIDKNLLKSETDHSTLDKFYTAKIGIVG